MGARWGNASPVRDSAVHRRLPLISKHLPQKRQPTNATQMHQMSHESSGTTAKLLGTDTHMHCWVQIRRSRQRKRASAACWDDEARLIVSFHEI